MCAQFNGGEQSSRTSGRRAKPFLGSRGEISRASCRGSAWAGSWRTRHGKRGSHWREYERKWRKCMKENTTMRHWSKETGTEWSVLSLALMQPLFPSRVKLNFYWPIRVAVGCMAAWSEKGQVLLSWEAGWRKIVCRSPAIPQTVLVSVRHIPINQEETGITGTAFGVSANQGAQNCHWWYLNQSPHTTYVKQSTTKACLNPASGPQLFFGKLCRLLQPFVGFTTTHFTWIHVCFLYMSDLHKDVMFFLNDMTEKKTTERVNFCWKTYKSYKYLPSTWGTYEAILRSPILCDH